MEGNSKMAQKTTTPRQMGSLLRIPHRAFVARIYQGLLDAGFTDLRMPNLVVFQHMSGDGARPTELADRAQMTKQSMNYLVDYLEACGYVERAPDPMDGRARIVRLTSRGWAVTDKARQIADQIEHDWAAHIGEQRMADLRRTLNDLIEALE